MIKYCKKDYRLLFQLLRCIDGVRRFRETHFNLAIEYIIKREKIVTGTAGSNPVIFLPNNIV